jgi:hypothetical protein
MEYVHQRGAFDDMPLAQIVAGVAQVLEGVDLQHHVKRLVAEHRQALVQVELDHIHAAPHAGVDVDIVQLDAIATAAALALQKVQQRPVAAAEVQHPRALRARGGRWTAGSGRRS